jgi:glycosyltransferase involved in cell wall biosynthesis
MVALSEDQREAALLVDGFRDFSLSQDDHFGFLREFHDYLREIRPDVVHVHHLLNFGLEALFVIRKALPDARIVLTIHDYYLICANYGQLYIHETATRCPGPALTECLKCFPERRAADFTMRALDIRNALSLCDRLVSPSFFLKAKFDRHLEGEQEIAVVENGYLGADIPPAQPRASGDDVVTFGYFGNISAVKGLADLLDAADSLVRRGVENFRVHVHGTQLFEDKVLFDRMQAARGTLRDRVRFFGLYAPEDMGRLMAEVDCVAFPSIWWENAPLVIYEALYHGRQVVSYPHGGAPEILARYGVGLVAGRSDPEALADVMAKVVTDGAHASSISPVKVTGRQALLANYLAHYSSC